MAHRLRCRPRTGRRPVRNAGVHQRRSPLFASKAQNNRNADDPAEEPSRFRIDRPRFRHRPSPQSRHYAAEAGRDWWFRAVPEQQRGRMHSRCGAPHVERLRIRVPTAAKAALADARFQVLLVHTLSLLKANQHDRRIRAALRGRCFCMFFPPGVDLLSMLYGCQANHWTLGTLRTWLRLC